MKSFYFMPILLTIATSLAGCSQPMQSNAPSDSFSTLCSSKVQEVSLKKSSFQQSNQQWTIFAPGIAYKKDAKGQISGFAIDYRRITDESVKLVSNRSDSEARKYNSISSQSTNNRTRVLQAKSQAVSWRMVARKVRDNTKAMRGLGIQPLSVNIPDTAGCAGESTAEHTAGQPGAKSYTYIRCNYVEGSDQLVSKATAKTRQDFGSMCHDSAPGAHDARCDKVAYGTSNCYSYADSKSIVCVGTASQPVTQYEYPSVENFSCQ